MLAHVSATAHLPASAYDAAYVAWSERHLGAASQRALSQDAATLGAVLGDHDVLSRAQLLAFLFTDVAQVAARAELDLRELTPVQTSAPELLPAVVAAGAGAEVLRAACELEADAHASLPPMKLERDAWQPTFELVARAAPMLACCDVVHVRSLRLRGRALGRTLYVGVPGACDGPSIEHVSWQAAHEATVIEVQEAHDAALEHAQLEPLAIKLLEQRAAAIGLGVAHRRWLAHLADGERLARSSLPSALESWLQSRLLGGR